MSAKNRTQDFLKISSQFKLGHLSTEGFHHKTMHLSELVKKDVSEALNLLAQIDHDAIDILKSKAEFIWRLHQEIKDTFKSGGKVFLCGCGATGRLSLVLETLFRQQFPRSEQVVSFMAGGDFALIKSVESFEDQTSYGERQLVELGFKDGDILLASTEGGETPFVIGAVNHATTISKNNSYFLYCNPDDSLNSIERSKEVLTNERIRKINLTVGPMAISGSTRMQASTVLMLSIGMALLYDHSDADTFRRFFSSFLGKLQTTDYSTFAPLTRKEAKLYSEKKYLNYLADSHLAISILTDTTERSPTFSLRGFENRLDSSAQHALSYLFILESQNSTDAWFKMLGRSPRPLEWSQLEGKIGLDKVLGFDISESGSLERSNKIPCINFNIIQRNHLVSFECEDIKVEFNWGLDPLFNHLMLKMLLNAHSTLIMGLLGRYEGNIMTWVRPSNNKLIDRAVRYILELARRKNKVLTYEEVVLKIFEEIGHIKEDEPVVIRVLDKC